MPVGVPLNCGATVAVKVTACPKVEGFCDEVSVTTLVAFSTTWLSTGDVLPANILFPAYTAVMDLVPAARVEVVKVATPLLSVAVPSFTLPIINVTLPVGFPFDAETVAVNVNDCPKVEGFSDEVTAVVVLILFTT